MTRLEQLGFNALLQLMIGVPLEMVHGLLRISLLYLAGVLAGEAGAQPLATSLKRLILTALPLLHTGSLTVSITDMRAPVVGGSGGVYALCSAHLANVVMVIEQPGWVWGAHKACLTACLMSHQNWAGMRCPYKLLRMVLALVCSK